MTVRSAARNTVSPGQVWRSRADGGRVSIAAVRDNTRVVVVYPSGATATLQVETVEALYELAGR
jgi:hypothetical protein